MFSGCFLTEGVIFTMAYMFNLPILFFYGFKRFEMERGMDGLHCVYMYDIEEFPPFSVSKIRGKGRKRCKSTNLHHRHQQSKETNNVELIVGLTVYYSTKSR